VQSYLMKGGQVCYTVAPEELLGHSPEAKDVLDDLQHL